MSLYRGRNPHGRFRPMLASSSSADHHSTQSHHAQQQQQQGQRMVDWYCDRGGGNKAFGKSSDSSIMAGITGISGFGIVLARAERPGAAGCNSAGVHRRGGANDRAIHQKITAVPQTFKTALGLVAGLVAWAWAGQN